MKKASLIYGLLIFLLTATVLFVEAGRPKNVIGGYASDLSERSAEQRENILAASRAIDGTRIEAGKIFSFNRVVGPRTLERGYRFAPAFLEGDVASSVGGGLCQVSSTLYAAVLEGGFEVLERVPHRFRVFSVPPGRDATVWYGKEDFAWRNDTPDPVRIAAEVRGQQLSIRILGKKSRKVSLSTRELPASRPGTCVFQTIRSIDGRTFVLLDMYRK